MWWPKLRSPDSAGLPFRAGGGGASDLSRKPSMQMRRSTSGGDLSSRARSPLNVSDEYEKALRTKSYTDMWTKFHRHHHLLLRCQSTPLPTTPSITHDPTTTFFSPLSSSTTPSYSHLSDYLDATGEVAVFLQSIHSRSLHRLLLDYFDITREAFRICAALLSSVDRIRCNHSNIRGLLASSFATTSSSSSSLLPSLNTYVELENPLTHLKLHQFQRTHDHYASLIKRLNRFRRKLLRRVRLFRLLKRTSSVALILACTGLAVVAVVVATHGLVGVAAAVAGVPLATWLRGALIRGSLTRRLTRAAEQVDSAAKGAYIVSRDLETMSRMVTRIHDEIEHRKGVVRVFLRSGGEGHVWREVVREMEGNEEGFLELVDELEEHVFWCLKTINRTRRIVVDDLGGGSGSGSGGESSGFGASAGSGTSTDEASPGTVAPDNDAISAKREDTI